MNIAIIPARGGSKRILKKNIRNFNGEPIIAYSIKAALKSGIFDSVIVSTDCSEIADISKSYGAEVPFMRKEELANDHVGIHKVITDCINSLIKINKNYEYVCCIYATAPLINIEDLVEGYNKVLIDKDKFVIASTNYSYPVQRSFFRNSQGEIEMLFPKHFNSRSQDLKKIKHDAGQFVWASSKTWMKGQVPFGSNYEIVELPSWRVQDIDDLEDWSRAELIYKLIQAS